MEFNKLDSRIIVYSNPFNNLDNILNGLKEKQWSDWYTFGDINTISVGTKNFTTFPTKNEFIYHINNEGTLTDADKDILLSYYECTSHYVAETGSELSNWTFVAPQICKYNDGGGADPVLGVGMVYHTDYQQEAAESPGIKHYITCNLYLNDNYDGGEIMFKIFDTETEEPRKIIYKPRAGDVIVFPSRQPYYHGVNVANNGEKYFVRSFWYEEFAGTEQWHQNKEKYGAEVWKQMENERQKIEQKNGKYHRNDKPSLYDISQKLMADKNGGM